MADPVTTIPTGTGNRIAAYNILGIPVIAGAAVIMRTYWSSLHFTNTTVPQIINNFFGGSQVLTVSNLETPNQIPKGREFNLFGVSATARYFYDENAQAAGAITPNTIDAMINRWQLILNAVVSFKRQDKTFHRWKMVEIGRKWNNFVQAHANIGGANDYFQAMFDLPNEGIYKIGTALSIQSEEYFETRMELDAPIPIAQNQHLYITLYLHGFELVGIQ